MVLCILPICGVKSTGSLCLDEPVARWCVFGFETCCVLRGQCFIFGALFPSQSGLIHKHA